MSMLVVEDNTISQRMLEVLLQSNGYTVHTAKNGRQALERLAEHADIQMILTDLMMPEMDGLQLLEEISKNPRWKSLPVIVLTSLSDADTVRRVLQTGCRNYLVKPLKEELLIPKVKALLAEAGESGRDAVLKSKFRVLEESGLDVEQYERIFDAFHTQIAEVATSIAEIDSVGTNDPAGRAILSLRDGAAMFTVGRLPAVLEGFRARGVCDIPTLRGILDEAILALGQVIEKRSRLKAKVDGGEASRA